MPEEWNPRLFPGLHMHVHAHLHIYMYTFMDMHREACRYPPPHTYLQKMWHVEVPWKQKQVCHGWHAKVRLRWGSKALKGCLLPFLQMGQLVTINGKAHRTGLAFDPGAHNWNHDQFPHFYDYDITSQILKFRCLWDNPNYCFKLIRFFFFLVY